jgi:opacity protein-like surface antigen
LSGVIEARTLCVSAMLLLVVLIRPAAAQTPRWEISGAYDFTRDWTSDINFPVGWTAGTAYAINGWFSAAAEAGGSYKTIPVSGDAVHLRLYTYLAGARARRTTGRFTEFGQVLAGAVRTSGTVFGVTSASTHLGIQPGGGADYALTTKLSARLEFDFRLVLGETQVDSQHHARFLAGIAYALH